MINETAVADIEKVLSMLPLLIKEHYQTDYLPEILVIRDYTYPYSHIRVVEFKRVSNDAIRLFIKRIIPNNKSKTSIQSAITTEADLLKRIEPLMSSGVVRLIGIFPDQLCLVTEETQGLQMDSLTNSLPLWWWQKDLHHNIATLSGDWLKQFHQATITKERGLHAWYDYLSGEMIWRSRLLIEHMPEHEILLKNCHKRYESDLNKLEKNGFIYRYHGDFAPHNIFFHNNKIQVIDFYASRQGHGLMDMVNFISSIATHSESPLYPKQVIKKFCYQFLDAYGQINSPDPRLPALILVLQAVKRLTVLATASSSKNPFSQINNSQKWYLDYLHLYLDDTFLEKTTNGPWPFMNLSDYLFNSTE